MTERLSLAGHSRIEREPGQGGMATVSLAHDVRHLIDWERSLHLGPMTPAIAGRLG